MNEKYLGSSFDDFLAEEGILAEVEAVALKRVIVYQIAELMQARKLSESEMAKRMNTSTAILNQLLDPANGSVTLELLEKAALALDKRLEITLI